MKHQLEITWQHIRRSPYQALAAVMIMALTVFVGLVFFLLALFSQRLLAYVEQKPQVIVFFNDTVVRADQVRETVSALKETGRAAKIEFISKEKALEIYRQRNAGDPLLLELVGANTLPASLEISAVNVTDLPLLYEVAKKAPNIEEIAYQKDIVNSLIRVTRALRSGGAVFLGFLVATALLTILTIIGMKIALRREEIAVEKLVGASAWYIRLPFLMEGFFYGAAGTVLSSAALAIVIFLALPAVSGYLAPLGLTAISPLFWLITGLGAVMISGLIGTTASFLAVWRYLGT